MASELEMTELENTIDKQADEPATLRAEVERLKARDAEWLDVGTDAHGVITRMKAELATLRAEVEKLTAANGRLIEQNNILVRKCEPFLSSADLKVVDRHCDWVSFGHAYRAMLNARAALGEEKKG